MESFWQHLPKPFFVLAPMADVTDPAYRKIIAKYGKPDVTWTEFVSADGLFHTREKKCMKDEENPLVRDLLYSEGERPLVAQLFSSIPENMSYAAKLCKELGFDGVDINMGCPDKSIERQGCGAGMMRNPENAKAIIRAAREGGLPVSVKTRIGYNSENIDEWLAAVLEEKPEALTVHLRTRKEMSKVPAHWELASRIVSLRDKVSPSTLIIGNGDVMSLEDAKTKVEESGMDGIMLGRAIFGNPWLFTGRPLESITPKEKLTALLELTEGFEALVPRKSFHLLKKHVKVFVSGWDGASVLRSSLMDTTDLPSFKQVLADGLKLV